MEDASINSGISGKLLRTFFITLDKRPGLVWRLLVYFFLWMFVIGISQSTRLSLIDSGISHAELIANAFYLLAGISGIIIITILARVFQDRQPLRGMALSIQWTSILRLLLGWLAACGLIALIFLLEYALGWIQITGNELEITGWNYFLESLLTGACLQLCVGFTEEVGFRGYVIQNIGEEYPLWFAALLVGFLFAGLHTDLSIGYFVGVVMMSTFFIMTRFTTGSIWFAIGFHGAWNWMQSKIMCLNAESFRSCTHTLLHLQQTGPALLLGDPSNMEGGLFSIGAFLILIITCGIVFRKQLPVQFWRRTLSGTGEVESPVTARSGEDTGN